LCFPSELLGRSVAECFGRDIAGASEVTALIGLRFDSYNSDFVAALRDDWITCEGRLTRSGRKALQEHQRLAANNPNGKKAMGNGAAGNGKGGKLVKFGER